VSLGNPTSGETSGDKRARRIDENGGFSEEVVFVGSGAERIFTVRYVPLRTMNPPGVLMCESILSEFRSRYRHGTLVARELAARGVAVQRFHYRGMGHSDGSEDSITFRTLVEDAGRVAEWFTSETDLHESIGFGFGMGSYVAGAIAEPGSRLIMDTPPASGRAFLRDAIRAQASYALMQGLPPVTNEAVLERMASTDDVTVLEAHLTRGLYESLQSLRMEDLVAAGTRVLLVSANRDGQLSRGIREFREGLESHGVEIEIVLRAMPDPPWFGKLGIPEDKPEIWQLINDSEEWIKNRHDVGGGAEISK
jgi:alpha/beta superfamily hydrolase